VQDLEKEASIHSWKALLLFGAMICQPHFIFISGLASIFYSQGFPSMKFYRLLFASPFLIQLNIAIR